MRRFLSLVAFGLALALSAFAGAADETAALKAPARVTAGWTGGRDIFQVVPRCIGNELDAAVIPTPRQVVYSNLALPTGNAEIVVPDAYDYPATLRDLRLLFPKMTPAAASEWREKAASKFLIVVGNAERNPIAARLLAELEIAAEQARPSEGDREGYLLVITRALNGRVIALLAGNSAAGDFWATQTLRQLLFYKDGREYAHGVWMRDWPAFPLRGSKEMRNYMPEYKDNFSWGFPPRPREARPLLENFGVVIPYFAPGETLDCGDDAVNDLARRFAAAYALGARAFAVKFDDVGAKLAPETAERFASYGAALSHFMGELDRRAKELDPACKLYYLPQTYNSKSGHYINFSRGIREGGGLPADCGLCWCGPEVFSLELPLNDIREFREAFGLTQTKGLIYDNIARQNDYVPMPSAGRGHELTTQLDGIFSESSARLTRVTRCDFNWNPAAYDPGRSLRLACRELAHRSPNAYAAIVEFIVFHQSSRQPPENAAPAEKGRQTLDSWKQLRLLLNKLRGALPANDPFVAEAAASVEARLKQAQKALAQPAR